MKKILSFITCLLLMANVFSQSVADKMDELVNAYAKQYKFNGTVLVSQNGQVVFSKGYGFKNAKDSLYNDVNTIYQLGSVTKQFTAAIILQLQQEKKLNVQDKLGKYFPGVANWDKISIENLLTHTSGIYNYTNDKAFMNTEAVKPATQEKMLTLFKDKPLDFEPGTKWSYSNSGYVLLGYIIAKVSGQTYEQNVRNRIFKPLQMQHSGFDFTNLKSPDKATGYLTYKETVKIPATIVDSSASFAAGAIYSTVGDLLKWHEALLGTKILPQAVLEKAFTPYKNHYGYGWGIDTIYGKRVLAHSGGIFGFNTNIARIPADDACIILLDNMNTDLDPVNKGLLAILYNKPYEVPKPNTAIKLDTAILRQYAGTYELAPTFSIVVTLENGGLKAQATNQPMFELFAESETKFFLKVVDAKVEFIKAADGKVEKLILYQNGREMPGIKVK